MVGLDKSALSQFDRQLAIERIKRDLRSDFIPAPHYAAVFENAADKLSDLVTSRLSSGKFQPQPPITIEVLKASGMTRPGSILEPADRLVYQFVADSLASLIELQIDRTRVYSNVLSDPDPEFTMFTDQGKSWRAMMTEINDRCKSSDTKYVLKADVANFFERLYQHRLINLLSSAGGQPELVSFLEKLLLAWTDKDSHGIVQGILPSDLLGNFYLTGIDAQFEIMNWDGFRFVDDMFVFFDTLGPARSALVSLCGWLRKDGLSLNEQKSGIRDCARVMLEESDLDEKFNEARDEVQSALFDNAPYGGDVVLDEEALAEIDLEAVTRLYAEREGNVPAWMVDRIDSFCLPVFSILGSDIAISDSAARMKSRPHLAKLYSSYLASLSLNNDLALTALEEHFTSTTAYSDWQLVWPAAGLLEGPNCSRNVLNHALRLLKDMRHSPALRAICAILVGKSGSAPQRLVLRNHYTEESSDYVRSALVFAAQYFPSVERGTCLASWGPQSDINDLVVGAIKSA